MAVSNEVRMREIVRAAGAALMATPQEQEMTYRIEFGSWPKAAANILRIARIALALVLAQIAQLSGARAHITCLMSCEPTIRQSWHWSKDIMGPRIFLSGHWIGDSMSSVLGLRIADIQPASIV